MEETVGRKKKKGLVKTSRLSQKRIGKEKIHYVLVDRRVRI